MTITVPKITKQYRLLHRSENGSATYYSTTAEGSHTLRIGADGSMFESIISGLCMDCAFGPNEKFGIPECAWPECPNRFPQGLDRATPPKMWVRGRQVPTVLVDGRYVPQDNGEAVPVVQGVGSGPTAQLRAVEPGVDHVARAVLPDHSPVSEPAPVPRERSGLESPGMWTTEMWDLRDRP